MNKKMVPCLYMLKEHAVTGFGQRNIFASGDMEELAKFYNDNFADELLIFDLSKPIEEEHRKALQKIEKICRICECPVMVAGNVQTKEDAEKLFQAGCQRIVLNFSKESNVNMLKELSEKFGKKNIYCCISDLCEFTDHQELIESYAGGILLLDNLQKEIRDISDVRIILHTDESKPEKVKELLIEEAVNGICGYFLSRTDFSIREFKWECQADHIPVTAYTCKIAWDKLKLNSDGMVPVIVQESKTNEVLMLAYMNREAYEATIRTGRMTYWSRSRNELWVKGLTSGHFQYVKNLMLDCDNDTILAKVTQIGAACHTGNKTCFFQEIIE